MHVRLAAGRAVSSRGMDWVGEPIPATAPRSHLSQAAEDDAGVLIATRRTKLNERVPTAPNRHDQSGHIVHDVALSALCGCDRVANDGADEGIVKRFA